MDFTRTFEANNKCNNMKCVWSHFFQILVVLKYHRRLWNNIFGIFMLLQMFVPKMLTQGGLWYFKTTKILFNRLQTWFILLHLALAWNVLIKSIWTHSAGVLGVSKNQNFFLQIKLLSFCAKIAPKRHKLQKSSKLKKMTKKTLFS